MSKNHSCPFLSEVIAFSWFSAHVQTSSEPRNTNSSFSKFIFKLTLVFPSNIFPLGSKLVLLLGFQFRSFSGHDQSTANALFLSVQFFPYKNTEKIKGKCFFLDHNLWLSHCPVSLPNGLQANTWTRSWYLVVKQKYMQQLPSTTVHRFARTKSLNVSIPNWCSNVCGC